MARCASRLPVSPQAPQSAQPFKSMFAVSLVFQCRHKTTCFPKRSPFPIHEAKEKDGHRQSQTWNRLTLFFLLQQQNSSSSSSSNNNNNKNLESCSIHTYSILSHIISELRVRRGRSQVHLCSAYAYIISAAQLTPKMPTRRTNAVEKQLISSLPRGEG
ncbi:hypothetical protein VTK56DRAFT_10185 [Thermocarpiscus australiensis]